MGTILFWIALYHILAYTYCKAIGRWRPAWGNSRGWFGLMVVLPAIPLIPFALLLSGVAAAWEAVRTDARDFYKDLRGMFD